MPFSELTPVSRRTFIRGSVLALGAGVLSSCGLLPDQKNRDPIHNPVFLRHSEVIGLSEGLRQRAENEFHQSYRSWKDKYIQMNGNTARVIRSDQGGDEVSEGVGYGLILAAHANDTDLVNRLTNEVRQHVNKNGLMSWRVMPDGRVPDPNSATDADLDIAYGLWVGGKRDDAVRMINAIYDHDVEQGTYVLKPGDAWGGSSMTSPAYFSPAYFDLFRLITNNGNWGIVASKSRTIIDDVQRKMGGTTTGLVPDWCTYAGQEVPGQSSTFGYNASRYPWRQAMVMAMDVSEQETYNHAKNQVQTLHRFVSSIDPERIVDGYTVDGRPIGRYHNAAFVGPLATTVVVDANQQVQYTNLQALIGAASDRYFSHSLHALSLLLLSEKMKI